MKIQEIYKALNNMIINQKIIRMMKLTFRTIEIRVKINGTET